ncbi:hypothetical protein TSUD_134960, partial [Trifolium subterraneum]
IHDICRHVKFDINSSSFSSVLGCIRKMLVRFLGKNATSDELIGIWRTAAIVSAVECLHAISNVLTVGCLSGNIPTPGGRLVLHSAGDKPVPKANKLAPQAVKLLDMSKERPAVVNMSFSTESSSSELQTIAFEMLSKAISRAGSSFPVDIWRSMLEVVRKTMDVMALKTPVVEDNAMSRYPVC